MDRRILHFEVEGDPVPQGSMRLLKDKSGNAYMTHASSRLSAYRKKLIEAIRAAGEPQMTGPVHAWIYFYLPRPKTVKRSLPTVKPDVDKLTRAVLDALEASEIVKTDAQVVQVQALKKYAEELTPRTRIYLEEMN